MLPLRTGALRHIAVLGAHCDDVPIGAGGTLLTLCRQNPGVRVSALVLTGGDGPRRAEEEAALASFCPEAQVELTVLDLPDGRIPAQWERTKEAVEEFRAGIEPDVVFCPVTHDAHQDHRTLAQLVTTTFRDHLVLGYEIIKWDSDLAQPNAFFPLADAVAREKSTLLHKHYPSQATRDWFDEETFLGLARIRGVQCRSRYAEGFFLTKLVISSEG
ncbi:PIG-L family deacetylase [Pseudonocardiaceae bacterium YIM PH 21723]|nr:PIG-L family deacetylase [Pseudonocardiaceae bacterium YIM PH 21723]